MNRVKVMLAVTNCLKVRNQMPFEKMAAIR